VSIGSAQRSVALCLRELSSGLWHWQAPHPDWRSSEPWDQNVSSYAIDDDERLLLFDPLGVPREIEALAAERETGLLRDNRGEARPYSTGDRLPFGADVFQGHKPNDTVLWVESQRAVISGDTLVDFDQGLEINERWLRPGASREEIAQGLRPLLDLPVEQVLATHGGPFDQAALERALSSS
jgi:hypothetical protein